MKINIKELRAKVKSLQTLKTTLETKEQIMNAVIASIASDKRATKTNKNITTLVKTLGELKEAIDGGSSKEVIRAVDDQTEAVAAQNKFNQETRLEGDEKNKELVVQMNNLIKEVTNLSNRKDLNQKKFNENLDEILNSAIEKVQNITVSEDLVADLTTYTYNSFDQISVVTEKYGKKIIKHNWVYDSKDRLIRVVTTQA